VLFNPVGNGPAWMPRGVPLVITIHDLAWLTGPQWYTRRYRLAQRLLTWRAASLASQIFTVSNHAARQIQGSLRILPGRTTVVRNGVGVAGLERTLGNGEAGNRLDRKSEKPTALFVGTLIRRKNLLGVWHAFSRIRAEGGLDVRLVVVGASRDARALNNKLKRDPNVRFLDYVDDQTLADLYQGASFLVMPSFEEGFGLPVLEAMAMGTPVITSSTGALGEIAGDAALLVDPYDEEQIASAMQRLFTDELLQADLRERGLVRASLFVWQDSARVALDAIKSTLRNTA